MCYGAYANGVTGVAFTLMRKDGRLWCAPALRLHGAWGVQKAQSVCKYDLRLLWSSFGLHRGLCWRTVSQEALGMAAFVASFSTRNDIINATCHRERSDAISSGGAPLGLISSLPFRWRMRCRGTGCRLEIAASLAALVPRNDIINTTCHFERSEAPRPQGGSAPGVQSRQGSQRCLREQSLGQEAVGDCRVGLPASGQ